jgi:hypothetical protein
MCPIDGVFTRLEPHFSYDAPDVSRLIILRHGSFVPQVPEFHQWRKLCWGLDTYHCGNQLAAERSNRELCSTSAKKQRRALLERQMVTNWMR